MTEQEQPNIVSSAFAEDPARSMSATQAMLAVQRELQSELDTHTTQVETAPSWR